MDFLHNPDKPREEHRAEREDHPPEIDATAPKIHRQRKRQHKDRKQYDLHHPDLFRIANDTEHRRYKKSAAGDERRAGHGPIRYRLYVAKLSKHIDKGESDRGDKREQRTGMIFPKNEEQKQHRNSADIGYRVEQPKINRAG